MRCVSLSAIMGLFVVGSGIARPGEAATPVPTGPSVSSAVVSLDDDNWLLATDPTNVGRDQKWFDGPQSEAKRTKVPWIIQDAFPGYHGVAWYWRTFTPPAHPHAGGRYLLRFWAVDYLAEVWLNGKHVGGHEGGEGVFLLDVTDAVRPQQPNLLAVRVLNPNNERIDGIVLAETCHYAKSEPFRPGLTFNPGGIVDSVELLVSPLVRVEDLAVRPDWKTGVIEIQANIRNASLAAVSGRIGLTVGPAAGGETLDAALVAQELQPGDTPVKAHIQVSQPRLWELNDPYLYRVTARVQVEGSSSLDESSTNCGFRDFRFADGHFRLNGRRLFLKSSHTATIYPIGLHWPHDPNLARREMLQMKLMGFNAIRFFCSVPTRYQLDLCDELGLMIYEESFAGWFLADSPKMKERFDHEVSDMLRRDRNHPCVVMWGLLNEMPDGAVFRHAVAMLPLVRSLDDTRVVLLNSGRFDGRTGTTGGGSMAGISIWQDQSGALEPNVTYNGTQAPISALGVLWDPGRLSLHPGPAGEFCVVRWTAPSDGKYSLSAKFSSIAEKATTDVHVLHNGKPIFDSLINLEGHGREAPFAADASVKSGDTIDFAVGWGNGNYGADSTGIEISIRSADGKTSDAAREFSVAKNPSGVWRFGRFKAGVSPDASTFHAYDKGRVIGDPTETRELIGGLSNPGSKVWEDVVSDQHPYQRVPHTAGIIRALRAINGGKLPVFISEYGIGSSLDLVKLTRDYEQLGAEHVEDARWYRAKLDQFMADWKRWNLEDTFASPEDYFARCLARMGQQRLLSLNCIRSNPNCVGHSMTGTTDCGDAGEGIVTLFRQLKPGTVDAIFDGWYPLRWCLFVEPVQVYRGQAAHLEAVLSNEDVLKPGEYPARVQVVAPHARSIFDKTITVTIPDPATQPQPAFALPVFAEDVLLDGPAGKYRFLVTFQQGAAAAGGQAEFYVGDPAELPTVPAEVALWGADPALAKWLADQGVRTRPCSPLPREGEGQGVREPGAETVSKREVLLASAVPPAPGGAAAFRDLARQIARGSTVVFLSPAVFAKGDQPAAWVPLAGKGSLASLPSWLYHKDEWAKHHPIFDGLPAGDLLDYTFYRDIIPDAAWVGQDPPAEVVAGAINTSLDYSAGLLVSVHTLGAGRFILNTLHVRENLGRNPAADRLLLNMLRYAARDTGQPLAELPVDFEQQLKTLGY
ncbi:MAG: glycoside hydrolase family 2 [Planctomycetota bacterium]|nr:glycoside hydrolase family 2 [Planctomycetota bacterium]